MIRLQSQAPALILMSAIFAAFFLYYPGLVGPLLFDDVHVLTNNNRLYISSLDLTQLIQAMESFNGDGRQFSMLSFALNFYFFGDSSWWLKCVNVIIHCINGFLLFVVARKIITILTRDSEASQSNLYLLPAFAVALWLISPINLTSVLYISQRMTLLSSFFILAGLWAYITARLHIKQTPRKALYIPLLIGGFTITGYLCKENGALLPLFIALIEIVVFRFKSDNRTDKVIVSLFAAGAILGLVGIIYVVSTGPSWLFAGYEHRDFTLIERVMTQFRALAFYLSQILLPNNASLSIWHDDFGVSNGLLSPPATILSAGVIFIMLVLAVATYRKSPVLSIAITWFFVAHSMESTILPLELVHEHRNYLASFGILLGVTHLILKISYQIPKLQRAMYLALAALFLWNAHILSDRANIWSDHYRFAEHGAATHPRSPFANFDLARMQFLRFLSGESEYGDKAKISFLKARSLEPDQIVAELALILASEDGAFDYDPEWLQTAIEKFPTVRKTAPLQAATISFLECLDWQKCVKSSESAHKLFDLFWETEDLNFISFYALYYWKIDHQPEKAEPAFERTLKGRDVRFWTYHLEYLVENEKWDDFCSNFPEFEHRLQSFQFEYTAARMTTINELYKSLTQCSANS